jgi:hypothetical protein
MLHRLALVRTDISEELRASFIRVTRIGELGKTLAVTSKYLLYLRSLRRLLVTASLVPSSPILVTLIKEALSSSETSVLTRATRRNIPEDTVLHSHRRENLKSYITVIAETLKQFHVRQFLLLLTQWRGVERGRTRVPFHALQVEVFEYV